MAEAIYRLNWDGYYGQIHGIFIAKKEDVDAARGKTAYLGEWLGKHSEVEIEIDELKMVTDDPIAVEFFRQYKLSTGVNPLNYLDYSEEDEDDE